MTAQKPRLLFITSPEAGQANCNLAVISALKSKHGDGVDIHLASYSDLEKRVPEGVTFHRIKGHSMVDGLLGINGNTFEGVLDFIKTPAGVLGALKFATFMTTMLHPESPQDYLDTVRDVERVIGDIDPDYIVTDTIMDVARDAIRKLGKESSLLMPNTAKDAAPEEQGPGVFSIPAIGTGFPYPLPWYLYPANIGVTLFMALWLFIIDKKFKALNKARNAAGYPGPLPVVDRKQERSTLCMSTVGADIPIKLPSWLVCCGPILQASERLEDVNKELYQWCQARPTILICLGPNMVYSEKYAQEMLNSVRAVLGVRNDIQVLWKLKKAGAYELKGVHQSEDRLRIVDWLEADPAAILKSGNIICFVNHGGSNSYHEGLYAGIPQVAMPAWADCYDFPARLEHFGIGAWGNPRSSPNCSEPELTNALLRVIGRTPEDTQATLMRNRAQALGRLVSKDYTQVGRNIAADHIWGEMQKVKAEKSLQR